MEIENMAISILFWPKKGNQDNFLTTPRFSPTPEIFVEIWMSARTTLFLVFFSIFAAAAGQGGGSEAAAAGPCLGRPAAAAAKFVYK